MRRTLAIALLAGAGAAAVAVALAVRPESGNAGTFPPPGPGTLARLTLPQRIVAVAQSQVGYGTDPASSYCNKFSAYWHAGTANCPAGESAEEWCADFAAWAWQQAGVPVSYGYAGSQINGAAVSFYEWAAANGDWHPATRRYRAVPGDVAVYGLTLGPHPSAAHVAIVTADRRGQRAPDVVNGDGDRTGFSVVDTGTDQRLVRTSEGSFALAGYVSPPSPGRRPASRGEPPS